MEITDASVPIGCFPRYQYMLKIRRNLATRYNYLMRKYELTNDTLQEVNEDNIRIELCKSVDSKDSFPDIDLIIPRHCDKITKNVYKIGNFGKRNKMMTNTHFILLPDTLTRVNIFPMSTIIIGRNLKTTDALFDIFRPPKNVDVCTEKNIRETLSIHLERYALSGMREACENLHVLLTGKVCEDYVVGDKRQMIKGKFLSRSKEVNRIRQRPQSAEWDIIDVLCSRPCRQLSVENGRACCPSAEHRKGIKRDKRKMPKNIDDSDREMIERLHEEFYGLFNRSILPKDERPRFADDLYKVDKKLLNELRDLSTTIESCGYCCSTFQINVNTKEISESLRNDIAKTLKFYCITKYSIVSSAIREFSTCKVGQEVNVKDGNGRFIRGTLGGFARTSSEESERTWALLSRHVAKCSFDRKLYVGNEKSNPEYCGDIMKEIKEDETNKAYLDIAAAALKKEISINSNFVTEDKYPVPGKPCLYASDELRGLNVHIQGATTPLGLGIITMPEQVSLKSENLDENYIIVEDRIKGKAFVKEGDSGAMVVAEHPDRYGEEVQLISMVMGERMGKEGSYTTVRLDKGLEQLKSLTDKDFDMC